MNGDYKMLEDRYGKQIAGYLRQRRELEEDDPSQDDDIMLMSKSEVLDEVCNWDGLINYSSTIKRWINNIYNIDLDEQEV